MNGVITNTSGVSADLPSVRMGRKVKPKEPKSEIARLLRDNLQRILPLEFRGNMSTTARLKRLDQRTHLGYETLRKMHEGIGNPNIEAVQLVAIALKVEVSELFEERNVATRTGGKEAPSLDGQEDADEDRGSLQRDRNRFPSD